MAKMNPNQVDLFQAAFGNEEAQYAAKICKKIQQRAVQKAIEKKHENEKEELQRRNTKKETKKKGKTDIDALTGGKAADRKATQKSRFGTETSTSNFDLMDEKTKATEGRRTIVGDGEGGNY